MATYNDIKKIKIGDNTFVFHVPTASETGALASNTTYVSTITTTAGAHTAISNKSGAVSFNVPTTAAHVGAAASSHAHGNITSGGDITATAPTIASGDQIIINDHSASKITNGPTFDGSTTTTALTPKGTWETFAKNTVVTAGSSITSGGLMSQADKTRLDEIPEHVELTQAEYDVLSTAEKNNGTVYFITDAEEAVISNSLVTFTPTLQNGFTLVSWGGIGGYKLGKLCIVNFHGVTRSQAVTSELIIATIPYTIKSAVSAPLVNNGSDTATLRVSVNEDVIRVNAINANATYMGQIIFFVED